MQPTVIDDERVDAVLPFPVAASRVHLTQPVGGATGGRRGGHSVNTLFVVDHSSAACKAGTGSPSDAAERARQVPVRVA